MATKSIAWNTGGGNITLTYQGQGDGTISVQSDENDGVARSQVITIETTKGSPIVTKNLTISQAACPFPVGDVKNYSYTGSVQSVTLPAGSYKLQCWGAQGGSNAAASSYGITAQAGGKGGYSEGVLTLTSTTTVYVFVGGQGSSSGNGGWNGGGGGSGYSTYNASNEQGVSRMGCGGGATDIALTTSSMSYSSYRTNRSSASLLSRMIVAGGGGGGAMCYKAVTTSTQVDVLLNTYSCTYIGNSPSLGKNIFAPNGYFYTDIGLVSGKKYKVVVSTLQSGDVIYLDQRRSDNSGVSSAQLTSGTAFTFTKSSVATKSCISIYSSATSETTFTMSLYEVQTQSSTTTSIDSQVGYVGGGTSGEGYSSTYQGKQNAAGTNGEFGKGANQTNTTRRYCPACGGGGWYGGGNASYSNSTISYVRRSGGGSGFVNVAASAGNRPSGYTGLQLDSGTTYAGNTSFVAPGGGNETGHAGNGYARITRLS